MPSPADLWKLAKTVDTLLAMDARMSAAFADIARRLDQIEGRLTRIEADRERVVTEAKSAAATAASVAASAHVSTLAHTMGVLEERVRGLSAPEAGGKKPRRIRNA